MDSTAQRGALLPVGEWNKQEITFKGSNIKVTLNETTILNQDISKIDLSKVKEFQRALIDQRVLLVLLDIAILLSSGTSE